MKAILAFDQGTTSSRAIAFGRDGRVLGSAQQEFRQIFPHPGWGKIWRNSCWAVPWTRPSRPKAMARELVVP